MESNHEGQNVVISWVADEVNFPIYENSTMAAGLFWLLFYAHIS